ncbi:MAG: radical SAM protein [Desulfovibrio sp.]|nr:radical SAM protein [Desulfovibrio sp.]
MGQETKVVFLPWEKAKLPQRVWPFFLPFMGCPSRCLYCAQSLTTGLGEKFPALEERLAKLEGELLALKQAQRPCPELAFYGGTFTNLPDTLRLLCLNFARKALDNGLILSWRCSTRPDCLDFSKLAELKAYKCSTVELGVQSFNDSVLASARRGYNGEQAQAACLRVKEKGFVLGVQLLPGLPLSTSKNFLFDVCESLRLGADCLRFYPCLVFKGTVLAKLYTNGCYQPWSLKESVEALALAYLYAKKANVPVIRLGLAPEKDLQGAILAGPWHPQLGGLVLGQALYYEVAELVKSHGCTELVHLVLPRSVQGFFWGDKQSLVRSWASLGLKKSEVSFKKVGPLELTML